jgi:hypothetical protein
MEYYAAKKKNIEIGGYANMEYLSGDIIRKNCCK